MIESTISADVLNPIDSLISSNKDALPEKAELPSNDMFGGGAMFGGPNPFQNLSQQFT